MTDEWRVLDTGHRTAAENMCLDRALLKARARDSAPDTVRFLQFSPPAVLVGFHQSVEQEIRESYCVEAGIDINRRITGGGSILFDEVQLGWEVISRFRRDEGDVQELYKRLCGAAIGGLRALGIRASFRPVNDIEVGGRKISGTGGTARDGAFLFQGTLLVDFDVETMLKALRIPTEKLKDKEIESAGERVTWLARELGHVPEISTVKDALLEGFRQEFGARLEPGTLTDYEEDFLERNIGHFGSDDWIRKVRRPLDEKRQLDSIYKAEGGLIRISLILDDKLDLIQYILITGDFFAYPERTVLDLESRLKNCRVRRMPEVVRAFFEKPGSRLPGVTAGDMIGAIRSALRKRDMVRLGLSPRLANKVSLVGDAQGGFSRTSVVLLPYCAKLTDCKYRYDEDCAACGKCTVGRAYELARDRGMEPITIVNFEHLWVVLRELREMGVESYIGCCCEPFYTKHREDFEAAGLPGVLLDVDNTTCYELDQEREGKAGTFKEETELDLDLLDRFIGEDGFLGNDDVSPEILEMVKGERIKEDKHRRREIFAEEKGLE